jgi:hypothetical protein
MKLVTKIFALAVLIGPNGVWGQSNCLIVDQISRWEILDYDKAVVYDMQGKSIAFVIFLTGSLKKSGETFRFFSSTICQGDRVQKSSGAMDKIHSIEPIRK